VVQKLGILLKNKNKNKKHYCG